MLRSLLLVLAAMLMTGLAACSSQNRPLQLVAGAGPTYPQAARDAGIEGEVVVRYDVDAEGRVRNARVVSAEPAGLFDQAALVAVRSWRFNPRTEAGKAVASPDRVSTVTFKLSGTEAYDRY